MLGWRAVLWKCPCRLLGVIKSYLLNYDLILFNYYDFFIGNKRNSAPGMERLSSKNPYRRRISSVSKKESWLYNKWYQVWQINNIFDRIRLVKLNLLSSCFSVTKHFEIRKQKQNIFGILLILIWSVCIWEVCLYYYSSPSSFSIWQDQLSERQLLPK